MGMKIATMPGREEPEALMDVNTTPLIDVMLVLLVMLILTIPTQLHSIKLDIGLDGPQTHKPVVHTVAIDFDGIARRRTAWWPRCARSRKAS